MKASLFVFSLLIALLQGAGAALAQTSQTTAAHPAIAEDPAVTKRALEWVERFQSGEIDRSQLNESISAKLTPQELAAMKKELAPFGAPTGIGYGGARDEHSARVYRYVVVFPVGAIQEFISIDRAGKIDGVLFLPVR